MSSPTTLPTSITVIGRRWFRKSYGNTYSSCQVLVDGVTVWRSGPDGGYGDYYLQMAAEWLYASGLVPEPERHASGGYPPLWRYVRDDLGIAFEYWAEDVSRERDL